MKVDEFMAAEYARDLLRQRRRDLRAAIRLARANPHNDGATRLMRWALGAYQ